MITGKTTRPAPAAVHKLSQAFGAFVVLAVLGGCASGPEELATLEQARTEMAALEQDPMAQQAASEELTRARSSLREAERALEEGEPRAKVEHLAYVANRNVLIAKAAVAESRARERIAQSEAERNRVLLESRERELARAAAEARESQQEAEAAQNTARYQTEQAEAARAELMRLRQQLTELQAKPTPRGMVLTLGDVLFDVGTATLKPGADLTINRLTEFLREHPDVQIAIEGHTDSTGASEYNAQLSRQRAEAVAQALESRGIPRTRMQVQGRGEDFPVANNETNAGRQQNRRVEIVFSDSDGRFASGRGASSR